MRLSSQQINEAHRFDDVDVSTSSHHHTLGKRPNQAASGNHTHTNSTFRLGKTVADGVPNATLTAIAWETEVFDPDEIHTGTNTFIIVKYPGKYLFNLQLSIQGGQLASRFRIELIKNGVSTILQAETAISHTGTSPILTGSQIHECLTGDSIGAHIYQDTGILKGVDPTTCFFSGMKVSD